MTLTYGGVAADVDFDTVIQTPIPSQSGDIVLYTLIIVKVKVVDDI